MRKRIKVIICITVSVVLILHLIWLWWLFPNVSIVGMFIFPVMVLFSIGAGIAVYTVLGLNALAARVLISSAIVIVVILIQISSHPVNPGVFSQASDYYATFWKYPDDIQFEDLTSRNAQMQIAAIEKFGDTLPELLIFVEISEDLFDEGAPVTRYYFDYQNGYKEYRGFDISVEDTGDGTVLIANPDSGNEEIYHLSTNFHHLLEGKGGLSVIEGDNDMEIYISVLNINNGNFHAGAPKIFTFFLRHFR